MKKVIFPFLFVCFSLFSNAQAFSKSSKLFTLGIGGGHHFRIDPNSYYTSSFYSRIAGTISVDGEFGVHKYVGVGFTAGVGGGAGGTGRIGWGWYGGLYSYNPSLVVPVGVLANFHFYQLIADKSSKGDRMKADKIDIYAGLNVGSGLAVEFDTYGYYSEKTRLLPLFFIGPQVGFRYYFKENIAVNAEAGYGKNWIKAGITFRM